MEQELLQLEARVNELKSWKERFSKQRFTYPLDYATKKILEKDNIVFTGNTYTKDINIINTDILNLGIIVGLNSVSKRKVLVASLPLTEFTVTVATNVFNFTGTNDIKDGDFIYLTTTDTLPMPLDSITGYYVINATFNTFKVALTEGGAEIDITDTGVGTHYFSRIII